MSGVRFVRIRGRVVPIRDTDGAAERRKRETVEVRGKRYEVKAQTRGQRVFENALNFTAMTAIGAYVGGFVGIIKQGNADIAARLGKGSFAKLRGASEARTAAKGAFVKEIRKPVVSFTKARELLKKVKAPPARVGMSIVKKSALVGAGVGATLSVLAMLARPSRAQEHKRAFGPNGDRRKEFGLPRNPPK